MIYSKFSKRQLMAMLWWQQKRYKDRDAIIADGSIRSGKTVSMTDGFVLWSMTCFNHQAFAICGKTIESLRRNVVLPLRDWLPGDFTIVEKRNENRLIISTPDGRENSYHLFGGRDESSYMLIQGMTLAGVMFDEVALMPRSFVEQACARCSVPNSKYWFNCNPSSPDAEMYDKRQNVTIRRYQRILYTMSGQAVADPFRANHKIASGFFPRFVNQQNQFLLGNGVTLTDANNKEKLGAGFDRRLQKLGHAAIVGGVAFGFWNLDHLDVFRVTEFVPLYDENNGALMASIRFWQVAKDKPLRATLYELDGYTDYIQTDDEPIHVLSTT